MTTKKELFFIEKGNHPEFLFEELQIRYKHDKTDNALVQKMKLGECKRVVFEEKDFMNEDDFKAMTRLFKDEFGSDKPNIMNYIVGHRIDGKDLVAFYGWTELDSDW